MPIEPPTTYPPGVTPGQLDYLSDIYVLLTGLAEDVRGIRDAIEALRD